MDAMHRLPHVADGESNWEPVRGRPIAHPRDLGLADAAMPDRAHMLEIFGKMSPDDRERFVANVVTALWDAEERDDLRPLADTVISWYWTLMFTTRPDWEAHVLRTKSLRGTGPSYSVEDLRAMLAALQGSDGP